MKKIISILVAVMLLLCACAQGSSDDATVTRGKKDKFAPSGQKVESSIFGRSVKYDGFTPAESISLPIESSDILDMLQIEKVLYFLTDGAVYTLDVETGASGKLFDTDATMFAAYSDTLYTYAPESGKLCEYSSGGELASETVLELQNEKLDVQDMFVTDDYYSFKCMDKSKDIWVMQHHVFDRETLEKVNTIDDKMFGFSFTLRIFSSYKGNSILKVDENPADIHSVCVYEADLETGKFTKLAVADISTSGLSLDFTYNAKTDTAVFFAAYKSEIEPVPMFISEYSLSDPDNIVLQRLYVDEPAGDKAFIGVYENIVSAISSADNEYRYFDYLNPPDSITLACQRADQYEDMIYGFEAETGIMVRTVSYGTDLERLDIKLMAGDTDFDLFAPIYYHQHKYFLADMFEDLSKYEGLKQRLDGDLAASYVSNLDGKYVGIPIYITSQYSKDTYLEHEGRWPYSKAVSRLLYLAQNIDVADGIFRDTDGSELYKLLRYEYDNPNGNESKMPFGKEINVLDCEFVLMNPSGTRKENSAKFLEYMFDVRNGDIESVISEDNRYLDIDSTDDVYIYWRIFAWDYMGPIYEAANTISQCDGKNSTIKEIAREAAAQVRMRLME